jgi:hypothetical protein
LAVIGDASLAAASCERVSSLNNSELPQRGEFGRPRAVRSFSASVKS